MQTREKILGPGAPQITTAKQHSPLSFHPLLLQQAGRHRLDVAAFTHHQEQTNLAAPMATILLPQVRFESSKSN